MDASNCKTFQITILDLENKETVERRLRQICQEVDAIPGASSDFVKQADVKAIPGAKGLSVELLAIAVTVPVAAINGFVQVIQTYMETKRPGRMVLFEEGKYVETDGPMLPQHLEALKLLGQRSTSDLQNAGKS